MMKHTHDEMKIRTRMEKWYSGFEDRLAVLGRMRRTLLTTLGLAATH